MCDFFSGYVSDKKVVFYDGLSHHRTAEHHNLRLDIREEWSEFEWTESWLTVRHTDASVGRRRRNVIRSIFETREDLIGEWQKNENCVMAAVNWSGHAIQYITNPSEAVKMAAVKQAT